MKVYSIGRETGCDIVINDSTDVISRRHATLNVTSSGKMTIIDQSHNGTYVNGIRISQNVPVPVTRKDNVSFAHVARLDWNMVPKTTSPITYVVIALIALLVIASAVVGYNYITSEGDTNGVQADTIAIQQNVVNEAKEVLKTKITEATGLKSGITDTAIADSLGAAIKSAQTVYDNSASTKEEVTTATDNLQRAIDTAKAKQTAPKHKPINKESGKATTNKNDNKKTDGKKTDSTKKSSTKEPEKPKTTSRGDH